MWTEPATGDVTSLRPNNDETWTVESDANPAIFVNLVQPDEEPLALGSLVLNGNADAANVYIKPTLNENVPYKPVSVDDDNQPKVSCLFHRIASSRLKKLPSP